MSTDCEGYHVESGDFHIRFNVEGHRTVVQVTQEAVEEHFKIGAAASKTFAQNAEDICARIAVWLTKLEATGRTLEPHYVLKIDAFVSVMKAI